MCWRKLVLSGFNNWEPLSCHLQGALDGGLDVPHSDKRFAGFKKDEKQLDADFHRNYIFGGHVASYMRVRLLMSIPLLNFFQLILI